MQRTEDAIRRQLHASDFDELTLLATREHGLTCTPAQAVNRHINFAARGIDRLEQWLAAQHRTNRP